MTAAYFEDHPTDPDKVILRKPRHEDDDDIQEYKKPWVGLTDEDIDLLEELYAPPVHPDFVNDADHCLELIRHVEAKLKEKNT